MNTETISTTEKPSSKGTLAATLSAVASVLAAATCWRCCDAQNETCYHDATENGARREAF